MNGHEFSGLSYKELQALALRYRVPGNIKKKLLIKVLQAAKNGNDNEVDKLLHDLRQNRKKRVRKVKSKLAITSTSLRSPNYTMADDYYCPPQQPPYQWVGAEEEIMSRDEDNKIPHYEEFCQFFLRRVQRDYQNYNDTNNNEFQDSTIVDLRTIGGQSQYQLLEDTNGNSHGPILLKKMLQAPAGANLGEIASPLLGGYRVWSIEQTQADNLLDNNSDTLTADSEKDENEDNFASNLECYNLVNNGRDEYFLNESHFIRNTEELGQHFPNSLSSDNQYKFGTNDMEATQNFQNFTNSIAEIGPVVPDIEISNANTLYYDNGESNCLIKRLSSEISSRQYNVNESANTYSPGQDTFNMPLSGDIQYCQTNLIPISQTDTSNTYCLQNLTKHLRDINGMYINPVNDPLQIDLAHDPYIPLSHAGTNSNSNNIQYTELVQSSSYIHKNHLNNNMSIDSFDGYNNNNDRNLLSNNTGKSTLAKAAYMQNEVLDSYSPSQFVKNVTKNLENILNYRTCNNVDYSKLEQTSCVYCYTTPIAAVKMGSSSLLCSQKKKYMSERREHSFTTTCLLYNDTSTGMRLSNLQINPEIHTKNNNHVSNLMISDHDNVMISELGETPVDSDDSLNDVWIHDYNKDSDATFKTMTTPDDENSGCFLSDMNVEVQDSQVDDISLN
ncbi:homeobox-like protein HDP1 isoform X2 [Prorops nasuta]|uniref:homeobox-like protein HDP1 isoform X2 n=1 Tax=Prorops nasuta TaxID=863751 RepID=UPI0034CE428C